VHGDQLDQSRRPGPATHGPAPRVNVAICASGRRSARLPRSRFESQAEFQMRMSSLKPRTNAPAT
jgi:hypothetical protein